MTSQVEMGLDELLERLERMMSLNSNSAERLRDDTISALRSLRQDAARFEWYFSDKPKAHFIPIYMKGLRERWSLDQWRSAIDAALQAEAKPKP